MRKWLEKQKARKDAIAAAQESFLSWKVISKSKGWECYKDRVDRKIEIIKNKMADDVSLTGEGLKKLQLTLQVWKEVQRLPKELEDNAKGGRNVKV